MRMHWLAVLLVASGCSSGPSKVVGDAAVLTAVSSDQQWVAVLEGATRLSTGAHTGALEVTPVSGGAPVMLDNDSSGGVFARGTNLWFLGGVTVVDEGVPTPYPHLYGSLAVWFPGIAAPAHVGATVREFTVAQNGAGCVFMDWDQKTIASTNTGKLVAVAAAGCTSGTCQPIVIDSGVTQAQVSWRISNDGRWVLATSRGTNLTDPGKVVLIDLTTGQMQTLSQGVAPRAAMMAPDGSAIAWVEGANKIVTTTPANPTATQTLTTTSPIVESATMIDAADFVAKTREAGGGGMPGATALVKVSAAGSTPLPATKPLEFFVSQYVPGTTSNYLFFAEATQPNGDQDLWLLDLGNPSAQPVMLGQSVDTPIAGAVAFSDDGTTIEYQDNWDPTTRHGDEYEVTLAMPARNLVATGIRQAAFEPSSTHLLYIDAPDPNTGVGVLTLLPAPGQPTKVEGVGLLNFIDSRMSPLRTYYTQLTGGSDDGVWHMAQP